MAFQGTEVVWKDGRMIPWSEATVHVSSHALHYGTGVFEGIRAYSTEAGTAVFRLDLHLERLFASAAAYSTELPYSPQQLSAAVLEVIAANRLGDCYVRPVAYLGSGSLSLFARDCPIEVVVFAWPWAAYLGEGLRRGARVITSRWRKFDASMMPTAAKACGQYVNSVLAAREALERGCDEAIMLDAAGFLAEGSGENLFLVKDGRLITNGEDAAILPGVTRASVLEIACDLGYPVEVRPMRPPEIFDADEVFFTGTAAEVTPVREVDGRAIGDGKPGPITLCLQNAYLEAVRGKKDRYRRWLTLVDIGAGERACGVPTGP